jgi:large subunit ribosomal protein L10
MVKPEKVEAVQNLKEKIGKAKIFVLTDFRGLTVEDMSELRQKLREKKVEYRVVKNLMAKRALMESELDTLDELLIGPTAIAFGYEDPVESVKVLVDFQKKQEKLQLKGGLMSGSRLDISQIKALASMPSQMELYAKMLGSLQAPISQLVWALKSATSQVVWALKAVGEKQQ